MGIAGDVLLVLVAMAIAFWAPLEVGFAAVIACWLLVPGQLVIPLMPHIALVDRAVLYVFAFRLLMRFGRPGEPGLRAYALTPLHAAFVVVLLVAFVDGSVLFAPGQTVAAGLHNWLSLLDLLVFFVVTLAVARTVGLWRVVRLAVAALLVATGIGLIERLTGHGWSRFFFEGLPFKDLAAGSSPLATRNGHARSQGAAQFALEYGWVLALLLPLVVVAVRRWFTKARILGALGILAGLAVVVAVAFSSSRSALVVAPTGIALLVLLAADRRLVAVGVGLALVGAVVLLVHPSFVTGPFVSGNATDPLSVRLDRLPVLFSLVAHRPFQGIGYFGNTSVFGGLDDSFAMLYANIGMIGLVAYCGLLVTAVAGALRAGRAPRGSEARLVGVACAIGLAAVIAACAVYDAASTTQTPWAIAFLGGLGTAAGELAQRRPAAGRRWALRALLPLVGVGAGFAVLASAPVTSSETLSIYTVAPFIDAYSGGPLSSYAGTTLVNTFCGFVTASSVVAPGTQVQCTQADDVLAFAYPGEAIVTVRAATPAAVRAEVKRAFTPVFNVMYMSGGVSSTMQSGRPAWAVTAPLWIGACGLGLMLLVPPLPVRRRRLPRHGPGQGRAPAPDPAGHVGPVSPTGLQPV